MEIRNVKIRKHNVKVTKMIFFQDFQRSRAFLFLNEIKRRFQAGYGEGAHTAMPYGMNTEFSSVLANEMVTIYLVFNRETRQSSIQRKAKFLILRH